jgi:Rho-binding antiterminator
MSKSNNTPYTPINCSYYDRIEAAIVLRKKVSLVYRNDGGQPTTIETQLKDTLVKNKEEFLIIDGMEPLRMDRIVSLDGEVMPGFC